MANRGGKITCNGCSRKSWSGYRLSKQGRVPEEKRQLNQALADERCLERVSNTGKVNRFTKRGRRIIKLLRGGVA